MWRDRWSRVFLVSASRNPNPFAEALALQVIRTVGAWLPRAVAVGTDTEQGGRYGDFCDASPSYGNPSELWFACEYIINYNDYVWNTRVQQMFVTG